MGEGPERAVGRRGADDAAAVAVDVRVLENAFSAQARFIANASHELRTPLAVARTALQIGLATTDPDRVNRVREELLRNNDR